MINGVPNHLEDRAVSLPSEVTLNSLESAVFVINHKNYLVLVISAAEQLFENCTSQLMDTPQVGLLPDDSPVAAFFILPV